MRYLTDAEVAQNFFCATFENFDNPEDKHTYEISCRKNELGLLVEFLSRAEKGKYRLVTFNGVHYDSPVYMYILTNAPLLKSLPYEKVCMRIYDFSRMIISSGDNPWWKNDLYRPYKYYHKWINVDLFLFWSKMLRRSKGISLKSIGIQLGYPVVQELPYDHDKPVPEELIPTILEYNSVHDITILRYMLTKPIRWQGKPTTMEKILEQKVIAKNRYGFYDSCYSWDDVKLGFNILVREYCNATGTDEKWVHNYRAEERQFQPVNVGDVILDVIQFDETPVEVTRKKKSRKGKTSRKFNTYCNSFYTLKEEIKRKVFLPTENFSLSVLWNGVMYDVGTGGLHSYHTEDIVAPDLDYYEYIDADVSSYYPTAGSVYKFVPRQFKGMDIFLGRFKDERLEDKAAGRWSEAALKKLALNGGFFGKMKEKNSPSYDPVPFYGITLNGQLLLLMLAQWGTKAGATVDSANTDGITFIVPKKKKDAFMETMHAWQEHTQMQLEFEYFQKVYRSNINNYLAIKLDGTTKKKGWFVTEPDLGNDCSFLIIPKCLEAVLVHGQDVKTYLRDPSHHIFDFCGSQKADRSYSVHWGGKKVQRLNRYYVSKSGRLLTKHRRGKIAAMPGLKQWSVQLYNEYVDKPITDYDIDFSFYENEVYKILNPILQSQQNLF